MVVEELATLVYLANLAVLELHVPQWRVDDDDTVQPPDELVFDLDPGEGTTVVDCARLAERLRDVLVADGLTPCPKTSGSKGMQVSAAMRVDDPARTSAYAKNVAELLARETPRSVTAVMAKDRRRGKIFVDWSQNNTAEDHRRAVLDARARRERRADGVHAADVGRGRPRRPRSAS